MPKVYSKALNESIEVDRSIGSIRGAHKGATVIFTGGIHGNEPSGVFALQQMMEILHPLRDEIHGNIYTLTGNLWALERGERFEKHDLNRLWTKERMLKIIDNKENELGQDEDTKQQIEIYRELRTILDTNEGPFYFLDLHTTSSSTIPFLTVNDTILNRKFSLQFPVPIILGIEEFLEGPLLSYINHLGYIAVGFESGQHDDLASIQNHLSFSLLAIEQAGCLTSVQIPNFQEHFDRLSDLTKTTQDIFEITHRHEIQPDEEFKMTPGFVNFSPIQRGQSLATSNNVELTSDRNGRVFMPLYQKQGNDGYFIVRKTPYVFLQLSKLLRRIRFDKFLALLPGVRWETKDHDTLIISLKTARYFAKEFLHLLGYRSKMIDETHMYAKNRERSSRNQDYKDVKWN